MPDFVKSLWDADMVVLTLARAINNANWKPREIKGGNKTAARLSTVTRVYPWVQFPCCSACARSFVRLCDQPIYQPEYLHPTAPGRFYDFTFFEREHVSIWPIGTPVHAILPAVLGFETNFIFQWQFCFFFLFTYKFNAASTAKLLTDTFKVSRRVL